MKTKMRSKVRVCKIMNAFYQGEYSSTDLPNSGHQAERSDGDAAPDAKDNGDWK